jgi:hypothetical protein
MTSDQNRSAAIGFTFLRLLWVAALCLAGIGTLAAQKGLNPDVSIDLNAFGIPKDFFREEKYCKGNYDNVRAIVWLNAARFAFAFNTNPECQDHAGPLMASIRLVSFDLAGKNLHSIDLPFYAGDGYGVSINNHIAQGPDHEVVVICEPTVEGDERITLLDSDLKTLQELDLPYGTAAFEGTTSEHHWVTLVNYNKPEGSNTYTYYSGVPLAPIGNFSLSRRDSIGSDLGENKVAILSGGIYSPGKINVRKADGSSSWFALTDTKHALHFLSWLSDGTLLYETETKSGRQPRTFVVDSDGHRIDLPLLPSPFAAVVLFGDSSDSSRIALGAAHHWGDCGDGLSQVLLLPAICDRESVLFVVDRNAEKIIFEYPLHLTGRAALSPDGKHIVVADDNKLLIYTLP